MTLMKKLFSNKQTKTIEAYEANKMIIDSNDKEFYRAIQRMARALRNTDVPKIRGSLIKFDYFSNELLGKCAIGVFSCEFFEKLTKEHKYVQYESVLRACGIPDEWINCTLPTMGFLTSKIQHTNEWIFTLVDLIPSMNDYVFFDCKELSFDEIAEFLETTFTPEREF